jgi:Icc-related predicted phosphoesterase
MTRILAFSDLHRSRSHAKAIALAASQAELVLGAGDFATGREGLVETMRWLSGFAERAVYVNGNAESPDELRSATEACALHGASARIAGVSVFGLGGAVPKTPFGDWSVDLDEDEARLLLERMADADVLLSHSPPKGVADRSSSGVSLGSIAVREAIERVQPKYCLCGHIHHSWGARGRIGVTEVINLGPSTTWIEV